MGNLTTETQRVNTEIGINERLAAELLAQYGSPLYVYDARVLRAAIASISTAISYPRVRFHFASVTNGNISLLRIFREMGWGLHANTPGDVYLGLKAGFLPEQIVYSGSNLNRAEFEQMLAWRVSTLNLDSVSQLELFIDTYWHTSRNFTPRIGFRLNLPVITGENRIGVRSQEFPVAVEMAARADLKITGIHFYRGTGTNSTSAFTESIDAVIEAAQQLPDWQYLDYGGGFGYCYRADRGRFDWADFGAQLSARLLSLERDIDLIIEPGRAAVAGCGILLTRAVAVKWHDGKQIVGVDSSIANIAVLSVHGGYREIRALKSTDSQLHASDVCGNTTFSRDYLGRGCALPPVSPGDMLAILDVGAYGYAMSSHFLHRPKPAEVLIDESGHRLIRKREGYEVLMETQEL